MNRTFNKEPVIQDKHKGTLLKVQNLDDDDDDDDECLSTWLQTILGSFCS